MAATTAPTASPPPADDGAHPLRPDVFISYARADQPFVQRLTSALEAAGKDVWVDLDDIRKGADWHAAMLRGVEAARVVVPVLTPAFAASAPCAEEVEHALEHNKRLLPIVREPVERAALREELTTPNWIFFDDDGGFDGAFRELVDAVDTDGDWLDEHARLLVRALEWKRADARTKSSLLLRGRDLRVAEDWLAASGSHSEQPTSEHHEYLVASRRAETRRQRTTLGGVGAALAVSLALTVFALIQRTHAIRQSHLATSRELAARANEERAEDPELALLLADRAARAAATPEAESALRDALVASRIRLRLAHRGAVVDAVYSPDGARMLTASGRTARLWRASDGKQLATLRGRGLEIKSVAFRPDGRYAVTTSYTGATEHVWVQVWDIPSGHLLGTWTPPRAGDDAHFDPTGRFLVTRSFLGQTEIWRFGLRTWHPARAFPTPPFSAHSDDFSPDGRRLVEALDDSTADAGSEDANFARIWDARTGAALVDLRGRDGLGRSARFSPDGRFVVTTGYGDVAAVWRADTGRQVATLRGHDSTVVEARFSHDGRLVVTASDDATARIWDARSGRELLVLRGHDGPVVDAQFSPHAQRVVTASKDGTARVWAVGAVLPAQAHGSTTRGTVAFSADGTLTAVGARERAVIWDSLRRKRRGVVDLIAPKPVEVVVAPSGRAVIAHNLGTQDAKIWDARAHRTVASFVDVAAVDPHAFDAAGTRVAIRNERAGFGVWDVRAKRWLLRKPEPERASFLLAALSADGTQVVTGQVGSAWLWDVATGSRRRVLRVGSLDDVSRAAFSPDGNRVAIAAGGTVVLYDVEAHRTIATLRGHGVFVLFLSFNADGSRLLTAGLDDTVRLWDGRTGELVTVFRDYAHLVTSANFSGDGRFVVTTSGDDAIRIADAATGREIAAVRSASGAVYAATFVGRSRTLVATHASGAPWLARCETCAPLDDLVELAGRRETRALTPAERAKYLH